MAVLLLAIIHVGIVFELQALDCMLQRSLKSYGQREKKETTTWIFLYKVVISSLRRTKNLKEAMSMQRVRNAEVAKVMIVGPKLS